MRAPDRSMLVITHYQRLLDHIRPDRVHVLAGGRIVASGGPELALELEAGGYDRYARRRMSLARAIATGDLDALPSRRDEDWRWTDLRGLIRVLPPASPAHVGAVPPGPFDGLADEEVVIVNGRGPGEISVAAGEHQVIALRFDRRGGRRRARLRGGYRHW